MRATVDGNARRSRRYSSDESAAQQDDSEIETYLDKYQQSTPMRPGGQYVQLFIDLSHIFITYELIIRHVK